MNYEELAKEKHSALQRSGHATVLAIETSCDETACAIVKDGREVLSNVVHTQIPLHRKYGGSCRSLRAAITWSASARSSKRRLPTRI